jgi:hypothetical protein
MRKTENAKNQKRKIVKKRKTKNAKCEKPKTQNCEKAKNQKNEKPINQQIRNPRYIMWIYSPILSTSSIRRRGINILSSCPSNWSMNPATPLQSTTSASLHLIDLCVYLAITMLLTGISSVHAGVAKSTIWLDREAN